MTKVKICGLSEIAHVQAAVAAGVDAIGFVFAPSRRRITIEHAKRLAKYIPASVATVGVFVNATKEEILQTYKSVPLDWIQYHGDETNEQIEAIGLPSIKAVAVRSKEDVERARTFTTDYLLFDTPGNMYRGGTGQTFDWQHVSTSNLGNRMIIAGGLNAQNVRTLIRSVQPFMVDVSSGVECNGRKDESLIRAFMQAVREEEKRFDTTSKR